MPMTVQPRDFIQMFMLQLLRKAVCGTTSELSTRPNPSLLWLPLETDTSLFVPISRGFLLVNHTQLTQLQFIETCLVPG